ncbi:MAG: DUF4910 domain-containing protein, partial [Planctomycetales bacterium]|nr:DUF4910 domain-containing protein [Planctomycetales bacterium]
SYKRTQQDNAEIDRVVSHLLAERGHLSRVEPFSPLGYDERQFCSPGFDLPVGVLMRSRYGSFPEYHNSGDGLDFVTPQALADSAATVRQIVQILEENRTYVNLRPDGEPMLGRYGIYRAFGEADDRGRLQEAVMWLLNQANGTRDILTIAERAGLPFELLLQAAQLLTEHGLLALANQ